jgi:hypothetical protein
MSSHYIYPPAPMLEITNATNRAIQFLLSGQTSEGYWHDYYLEVGSSRAWTTAYIAFRLSPYQYHGTVNRSLGKAQKALRRIMGEKGWGYNLITDSDADSTAWSLRFLQTMRDPLVSEIGTDLLRQFVSERGEVRTFSENRYGRWSNAHIDVAPVVGMALAEGCFDKTCTNEIYSQVITAFDKGNIIEAFWWDTELYAWAMALEFLYKINASRKATKSIARHFLDLSWKCNIPFQTALLIHATSYAHMITSTSPNIHEIEKFLEELLMYQVDNGSWPGTAAMKIPGQCAASDKYELATDYNGFFTTATALNSLRLIQEYWLFG